MFNSEIFSWSAPWQSVLMIGVLRCSIYYITRQLLSIMKITITRQLLSIMKLTLTNPTISKHYIYFLSWSFAQPIASMTTLCKKQWAWNWYKHQPWKVLTKIGAKIQLQKLKHASSLITSKRSEDDFWPAGQLQRFVKHQGFHKAIPGFSPSGLQIVHFDLHPPQTCIAHLWCRRGRPQAQRGMCESATAELKALWGTLGHFSWLNSDVRSSSPDSFDKSKKGYSRIT